MSDIMNKPSNRFYISTGTIVGRANGRDHRVITDNFEKLDCDGFELMMQAEWYGKLDAVAADIKAAGVPTPVIHFDKEIGVTLAEGNKYLAAEAMARFEKNASVAEKIGAKKAVFHLWGGPKSDGAVDMEIGLLPEMMRSCREHGVTLMIENIPCVFSDPLSVWQRIAESVPDVALIFDTRFGAFHGQYIDIFASRLWKNVIHMHVSSYAGKQNEFGLIRPILHPGEGTVDFDHLISNMPSYRESVTLESPVLGDDGTLDLDKLQSSVNYLREKFALYRPDLK